MAKQTERTAQTKQKLIDAFWELYYENKIEKITIKAITDKAGFYRSTFYEYFSDVYEILEDIENELLSKHRAGMEKLFHTDDILKAQEIGLTFCMQNAKYLAVLLGPNGDRNFYITAKEHIAGFIQEYCQADDDNKDMQIAIELISNAIITLIIYWYQHQDSITLPEVFSTGIKFMQNGAFSLLTELDIPFLKS